MPDPNTPPPSLNTLLDQIGVQGKRALRYSRTRFLGTWFAIAVLAMLTGFALLLAEQTANRQDDAARALSANASHKAKTAQESTDQIVLYLQGKQGIPGVPGANGQDGAPGQPGSIPSELPPGPRGPQGHPGPRGPLGEAGLPGADGLTGPTGFPGEAGPAGPIGVPGATGAIGATGLNGTTGATGEKGAQGSQGDAGATGGAGPVGPAGPTGPRGETGPQGATGPQGPTGAAGPSQPISVAAVSVQSADDVTRDKDLTATCPTGSVVLSGGYHWTPATPGITVIADEPATATSWHVEALADTFPANSLWQLTVFAMCNVTPPTPK